MSGLMRVLVVGCWAAALASVDTNIRGAESARDVLAAAVAAWHFGDLASADGKSPLKVSGDVALGVELTGAEREASLARGGDGKVAQFNGGWLDAAQGGDGRLNLTGDALTLLLRFRNPTGQWANGELFCKHGGHDKLVYNLYTNNNSLGFEIGTVNHSGLGGQVSVSTNTFSPQAWYDLVLRYDGQQLTLFVDGMLLGRTAATGALRPGNTQPVLIGRRGFKGQIDHVALWSRALSDDEIIAVCGGPAAMQARRQRLVKDLEARLGREDLTLADQLKGTRELRMKLWNDPFRPRYHLLPPDARWNDINGTIYWKGRYHVFFLGRLAPNIDTILAGKDSDHARELWLHASSRDLVHWIHHPPAMTPVFDGTMPRGLYSGDAIDNAPVPTLIFHVPGQGTCIATAEDDELLRWKFSPHNPVIPQPKDEVDYIVFDPCAWKEGDVYYALIGNKNRAAGYEGDTTSLFRSKDLITWEYLHPFYQSQRKWTDPIEDCACPDFFPLGNKHVLMMHVHRPYGHSQYYIGRYENQRFYPEIHGKMTWPGGQMCAPETLRDGQGRRIFWGWVREAYTSGNGWSSVASLPRVLSLGDDGTLRIVPAPELAVLRTDPVQKADISLPADGTIVLDDVRGDCLELNLEFEPGDAKEFGLAVRCAPDGSEQTPIIFAPHDGRLKVELTQSTLNPQVRYPTYSKEWCDEHNIPQEERTAKCQAAPFELKPGEPLRLRVFVDRSIVEVFANDRQCVTQRIYPSRDDSLGVTLIARGGTAKVKSLHAWRMSPTNSW